MKTKKTWQETEYEKLKEYDALKPQHTPMPWKAAGLGIFTDEMQIANIHPGKFTRDSKRHPDETVPWPAIAEGEENAAFIVRVANHYETMVNLLRKSYQYGGFSDEIKTEIKKAFDAAGEVL